MAMNYTTNPTFTGRITGATPEFPYGSSKNESSPGANDGMPHNLQRANDILGFQQALLSAAGITPTGDPDNVGASQYLDALRVLFEQEDDAKPLRMEVVEASGTYTPSEGVRAVRFTLVSGGGGGGGTTGGGTGSGSGGGGGGSGGTGITFVEGEEVASSYSIVIGAGGVSGTGQAGTFGGESYLTNDDSGVTFLVVYGGPGGFNMIATAGSANADGGARSARPDGDFLVSVSGQAGENGCVIEGATVAIGEGGHSSLGSGGPARFGPGDGSDASGMDGTGYSGYGGGGGGASSNGTNTDYAGGDGAPGVCIIEEFF